MVKKSVERSNYYIPSQRFKKLEYEEPGVEGANFWARVRTSLTGAEFESLTTAEDTPLSEAHLLYAPYVVEWNAAEVNDDGEVVLVPPPAEGGPEMFERIPAAMFIRVAMDLRRSVFRPVDPKPLTLLEPTGEQSPNGDTKTA